MLDAERPVDAKVEESATALDHNARKRRSFGSMLHRLERREVTGIAVVRCRETVLGRLMLQRGRICFAVAEGEAAWDSDDRLPSEDVLDEVAVGAAERGIGLTEAIRGQTADRRALLRRGLFRATTRAARSMFGQAAHAEFAFELAPALDCGSGVFGFSAVEILVSVARSSDLVRHDVVAEMLFSELEPDQRGLFLLRDKGREEMPLIAAHGFFGDSISRALDLSRVAAAFGGQETDARGNEPEYSLSTLCQGSLRVNVLAFGMFVVALEMSDDAACPAALTRALRFAEDYEAAFPATAAGCLS